MPPTMFGTSPSGSELLIIQWTGSVQQREPHRCQRYPERPPLEERGAALEGPAKHRVEAKLRTLQHVAEDESGKCPAKHQKDYEDAPIAAVGGTVPQCHPAATAALLIAALLLGALLGAGAVLAITDPEPTPPATPLPAVSADGALDDLPPAPVEIMAETVRLPAGFDSTHVHGGPTFNTVLEGVVEIREDGVTTRYETGDFFFEPADFPHRISVLSDARLHVLRLLPPGAAATTEVDPAEVD